MGPGGTVLQDADGQFIGRTVGEDIAFALENDCVPLAQMKETVQKVVMALSVIIFKASELKFKQIKLMLICVVIFLLMNFLLTYLFSPQYGTEIYGTTHEIFLLTTNPSEFAASLNRVGLSYKGKGVIGSILLVVYSKTRSKKGSLTKEV